MTPSPFRVCVVCTGNICRSPVGEYLLRDAFERAGFAGRVEVDSAGTSNEEVGNRIDTRSAASLRRAGHNDERWRAHRARQFESSRWDAYGLVLPATAQHQRALERTTRDAAHHDKIRLLRSFDPVAMRAATPDLDDPWYDGRPEAFDRIYREIAAAVPGIVEFVALNLRD